MNTSMSWLLQLSEHEALFTTALLLTKVTVLLAIAWLVHVLLRKANPRWRVLLWRSTGIGMLLLIALTACPPILSWGVLPLEAAPSETLSSRNSRPSTQSARQAVSSVVRESPAALALVDDRPPGSQAWREDRVAQQQSRSRQPLATSEPHRPEPAVVVTKAAHAPVPTRDHAAVVLFAIGSVWLAGLVGQVAWTLFGLRRLGAIIRRSQPVPDWVSQQAECVKDTLGYKRSFMLRKTAEVATPCLFGIWRPVVLLPQRQADTARCEELPAILMHETAHLNARDLPWNGVLHALSMLFWFHPLVWRIRLAQAGACDAVADSIAADYVGDVRRYIRTLASLAVRMHGPAPRTALAMAGVSNLWQRIELLQKKLFLARLPRGRMIAVVALGAIAVGLLGGVALTRAAAEPRAEANDAVPKQARLVIHATAKETGEPLEGVKIQFRGAMDQKSFERDVETDHKGIASVEWDATAQTGRLSAFCAKDGFVPIRRSWREGDGEVGLPEEVHLQFQPGRLIGGIVQDQDGQPLEGVLVRVRKVVNNYVTLLTELTTGSDGRWRWNGAPSDLSYLLIYLEHPEYVGEVNNPAAGTETAYVMKRGHRLTGRVLTTDGAPIEGAGIQLGYYHWARTKGATDSEGRFVLENCEPGESLVTIEANGFSPERRDVVVGEQEDLGDIQLAKGHTLRVRVVNRSGDPIPSARIDLRSWRDHQTLRYFAKADNQGRILWPSAPPDTVLCDFDAPGYLRLSRHPLQASDKEHVVTLSTELSFSGNVTDATTGQPIPFFILRRGQDTGSNSGHTRWWPAREVSYKDGVYQFQTDRQTDRLQVEAPGYHTKTSRLFKPDEGAITFDFSMQPGADTAGTVLNAEGNPVADAHVGLATAASRAWLEDGHFNRLQNEAQVVTTNESGKFTFPPQGDEPFLLIITHDSGFAQVIPEQFENSSEIRLKPWGRIEGQVSLGDKPDANRVVWFHPGLRDDYRTLVVSCRYSTKTDARGHFELDRVIPGPGTLTRAIARLGPTGVHHVGGWQQAIDVRSGQTTIATIGGTGRLVVGRIGLDHKPSVAIDDITNWSLWIRQQHVIRGSYEKTLYCQGWIDEDGRFEIPDVPPGDYHLLCRVQGAFLRNSRADPPGIGIAEHDFTVGPMDDTRSDDPLDLGVITVKVGN